MAIVKTFNHPLHLINYMRAIMKSSLSAFQPKTIPMRSVPNLRKNLQYYFIFETHPRTKSDQMLYALCCFAEDGEIIFNVRSCMPVGLWRYRRQGMATTAQMIQAVIKSHFKRFNVPLDKESPFSMASEGLYIANICWFTYKQLLS